MRIALFFWSLALGGVEHMMVNLSRELAQRGHDVTLILARGPQEGEYQPDGRVKVIRLNTASTPAVIAALAGQLRRGRFDIVYTAMPTSNVAAVVAHRLSGSKSRIVLSERSNPELEARHSQTWRYRLAFALQPLIYPMADAIVAVSHGLADELARFARLKRETISVIYNPAFVDRARSERPTHRWLDDKTVPVIVAAGRLTAQKDFSTLIRAFAELRKQRQARLIVLGEGPDRKTLTGLVGALQLEEAVELPGLVHEIGPFLAKADVFALTSIWEGFGNVLVEALGAGCSIVSTDCRNGPSEILADGTYGKLVPVGDIGAVAQALATMIDTPLRKEEQRARAQFFSAERSADAYEALFFDLVGARH